MQVPYHRPCKCLVPAKDLTNNRNNKIVIVIEVYIIIKALVIDQ